MTTDVTQGCRRTTSSADAGIDVKYGITANLTADVTVNTDFAQVEVDEQQVNLTRFSLQFPEKRDFFLEGRGIFDFARGGVGGGGGTGRRRQLEPDQQRADAVLQPAHRLNAGRVIPIDVGGRVTGKVGKFGVGALNIADRRRDGVATRRATNFTVAARQARHPAPQQRSARCSRTGRSRWSCPAHRTSAYGVDAAFSFFQDLNLGGYYARSADRRASTTDNDSYQARVRLRADRYGVQRSTT